MASMLEIALAEFGEKELPGSSVNNPRILHYAITTGADWVRDDESSWCGLFAGFCAKTAGFSLPASPASARSWLKFGTETKEPVLGDIAILWRDSRDSWKGHVGIFIKRNEKNIYLLGGNQGDQVCIAPFPNERVLGFRKSGGK